jgi:hypothetical protein
MSGTLNVVKSKKGSKVAIFVLSGLPKGRELQEELLE